MSTNSVLDLILEELKQVQASAEKLREQAQDEAGGEASAQASEQIQAAVKKIEQLIRDYERLHRGKSA